MHFTFLCFISVNVSYYIRAREYVDTRNHFVFCSSFLLLLLYSSREESIFASVPFVQGLIEEADDFCLCFEKGLKWCLLPYNGALCSGFG